VQQISHTLESNLLSRRNILATFSDMPDITGTTLTFVNVKYLFYCLPTSSM